MNGNHWNIYLSGEIHSNWREKLISICQELDLPVKFRSPVLDHQTSDDCGDVLLGKEENSFWKDHKAAKINGMRTKTLLADSDIVVVRFGEKYKQWNAAFEAGFAAALGKSLIVLHDESLTHALKEVDAAADAVAKNPEQVAQILKYIITGTH